LTIKLAYRKEHASELQPVEASYISVQFTFMHVAHTAPHYVLIMAQYVGGKDLTSLSVFRAVVIFSGFQF